MPEINGNGLNGFNGLGQRLDDRGCAFGKVNRVRIDNMAERIDQTHDQIESISNRIWAIALISVTQMIIFISMTFWFVANRAVP